MTERARAGELIDGTLRLLLRHPGTFILPLAPFAILVFLGMEMSYRGPDEMLTLVVALFGGAFVVPAITRAAFMPLLGEGDPRFLPAFAALSPVRAPAAFLLLVSLLAMLLAFVAFVVPGLLVAAFLVPVSAVVVAEGLGPAKSVARARELVRGRFVSLVGALLVPIAIVLGFTILAEIPRDFSSSFTVVDLFESIVFGLGFATGVAYWAVLSAVLYAAVVPDVRAPTIPETGPTTATPAPVVEPMATGVEPTVPGSSKPPH